MVTAGFFLGGEGLIHVQAADENRMVTERLERFRDEREFEIFAFLQRTPIAGRCAMRMPYAEKPFCKPRSRGRLAERSLCRKHRLEERQRQSCTDTAQKRTTRNVFLRDKHC